MKRVLNIGPFPGRKRKVLSVTEFHDGSGASVRPLAYFVSEAAFKEFEQLVEKGLRPLERESA